jgi:hypothetical protein
MLDTCTDTNGLGLGAAGHQSGPRCPQVSSVVAVDDLIVDSLCSLQVGHPHLDDNFAVPLLDTDIC